MDVSKSRSEPIRGKTVGFDVDPVKVAIYLRSIADMLESGESRVGIFNHTTTAVHDDFQTQTINMTFTFPE